MRSAEGRADIAMWDTPGLMPHLDAGKPIVLLAGVHAGCYELFGNERVRSIRDLKGKTSPSSISGAGTMSCFEHAGIRRHEPRRGEVDRGENMRDAMNLFVDGKADAFLGFAQQPAELRAKEDRPRYRQYRGGPALVAVFLLHGCRQPRLRAGQSGGDQAVVRAILKAADICAADPERVARYLSDKLYEPRFQIGLGCDEEASVRPLAGGQSEDTIRFHSLAVA